MILLTFIIVYLVVGFDVYSTIALNGTQPKRWERLLAWPYFTLEKLLRK